MSENEFNYRVLGWRPVPTTPIFAPPYHHRFTITREEIGSSDDASLLTGFTELFIRVDYLARYDGFYVADIVLDREEYLKSILDDDDPDGDVELLNTIAERVCMAVKTDLGHQHYFHAAPKSRLKPVARWRGALSGLLVLASALLLTVYLAANGTTPYWLVLAGVAAFSMMLALALYLIFAGSLLNSAKKLSPAEILVARPVQLDRRFAETPLAQVPFHQDWWLKSATARLPANAHVPRAAIGQLRRGFIHVSESVSRLLAITKTIEAGRAKFWGHLFWFGFFVFGAALISSIVGLIVMSDFPRFTLLILLGFGIILFGAAAFGFVVMILNQDLPKVKFLRAAKEFIASANTINAAIENVLNSPARMASKVSLVSIRDFSDHIRVLDIQLAGELHSLQLKQFWAASCAALLGSLAVLGLLFDFGLPNPAPEPVAEDGWRQFDCLVDTDPETGLTRQRCTRAERPERAP